MNFNYSIQELNARIGDVLDALDTAQAKYCDEGIRDEDLGTTLGAVGAELEKLRERMSDRVAAHAGTYEMISYLNGALQLEYKNILEYERYVDAIDDSELAERFRRFGQEEWQHARVLSQRIADMGGEPRFEANHEIRPDMNAYDLLREHYENEQEVVKYYEMGLERFDDPAFAWLLGKIKVEEEEHVEELKALLEEYRDTAVLVQESKTFRWTDPYMGQPGDRAWIE